MAAPQNFVSVSRRPPDIEDYIDILRRYRSWIVGPTFAGLVISVVVAFFTPDVYVCTAAMQIRPSVVSRDLLPSAINGQMQQKLQQLSLDILGRDNLILWIQKLNLYPKERARSTVEDVAEDYFRKAVHIVPYAADGSSGAQAFRIVFSYPDKYVAQKVVSGLVTDFQNKDLSLQVETNTATNMLFSDLVKNAKDNMEAKQVELASFTAQNQGKLPENFGSNSMEVQARQAAIAQINQQISQEKQRQALLEANLNNNKNTQSGVEPTLTQSVSTPNQQVRNTNLTNIEGSIQNKQQECIAIENKYQENYPDVITCKQQLKLLEDRKAEIERAEPAGQPGSTTRIAINTAAKQQLDKLKQDEQAIRAEINASVLQVAVLEKNLNEETRDLKIVRDKIDSSPPVVQTYNQLASELQMAKEEYTNLSSKKDTAGTQQQVQEHRVGEKLQTLESPIPPDKPTSPIRGVWVGIGTVMGLVFGIALAGAKEVKNTSLKNLKDVRAYTNLPVLSSIPLLENALLVRRKRRLAWLAWSSALIVGTLLMSGAMYYKYVMLPQG
jgi:uncharacterized protein involved in exopolysaccharide biosynthesis